MSADADGRPAADRYLRALHRRIAFVFDFDETLAPRTTDALLDHLGADRERFESDVADMVDDGWEKRLAEARCLVALSRSELGPITSDTFRSVGQSLEPYPGVVDLFDRVRAVVADVDDSIDVEFHLLTAGFVEIPEATSIAGAFTSITGGHWALGDDDVIDTPKSTVGHYDKVRHVKRIAKGLPSTSATTDRDVDADRPERDWHVPYEQMVFVADGDSDLPTFDFMESHGGVALAVGQSLDRERWENFDAMRAGRRVLTLLESVYTEGSPLTRALTAAARRAALRIEILATSDRD